MKIWEPAVETELPLDRLEQTVRHTGVCRVMERFAKRYADCHMKNIAFEAVGPGRLVTIEGQRVVNFGSDSFLGLDQDPRVAGAIVRGLERWGAHSGASRMFASVQANVEAEERLAKWMGAEATLIFPSVTLANHGVLPGLVGKDDVLVLDEHAHHSMNEGAMLAAAAGTRTATFAHSDPHDLGRKLRELQPYRIAVVAVDGVYSMSGALPPLADLQTVARANNAVLYVDDAHGTGVLGTQGRGTVLDALGSYDNVLVAGSLSKAFSCLGGFIACPATLQPTLKYSSSTYIFGGPVPPPYLEGICAAIDILESPEFDRLKGRLDDNLKQLVDGARQMGLHVMGGLTPIVSILVGDEGNTFRAGRYLFEQGYYVQSVTFPAVPYHRGVLRVQVNSNHEPEEVAGLLDALTSLQRVIPLPTVSATDGEERHAA